MLNIQCHCRSVSPSVPVAVPGGITTNSNQRRGYSVADRVRRDSGVGCSNWLPNGTVAVDTSKASDSTESADSTNAAAAVDSTEGIGAEGVWNGPEARLSHELEKVEQLEPIDLSISVAVNLHERLIGLHVADITRYSAHPEEFVEEDMQLLKVQRPGTVEVVPHEHLVDVLAKHHVVDVHRVVSR